MARQIRTAVIGVGKMGGNHARVYAGMPAAELVGVYDADEEQAVAVAHRLGCHPYRSLEALLAADVEAVSVVVPTVCHAETAQAALEAGKHVLVEKPIAATLEEAEALMACAEQASRKLMVGHIERFNPAIATIKAAVMPAEIITINIMRVGPLPPRIKDAGVIKDMAVHDIDLVHYLTQAPVEDVYSVTSSTLAVHEDTASILLRVAGGISAQITTNWITPYKSREIQVITADRLIKGNLITQQVQVFSRFSDADQSYIVRDLPVKGPEPLRQELEAFVSSILTDGPVPISGADGYHALAVAEAASRFSPIRKAQPLRKVV